MKVINYYCQIGRACSWGLLFLDCCLLPTEFCLRHSSCHGCCFELLLFHSVLSSSDHYSPETSIYYWCTNVKCALDFYYCFDQPSSMSHSFECSSATVYSGHFILSVVAHFTLSCHSDFDFCLLNYTSSHHFDL